MAATVVVTFLIGYLVLGVVFLVVFDLTTHRIRRRFSASISDSQILLMGQTQAPVGRWLAGTLMTLVMIIAWPSVVWGWLESLAKKESGREEDDKNAS